MSIKTLALNITEFYSDIKCEYEGIEDTEILIEDFNNSQKKINATKETTKFLEEASCETKSGNIADKYLDDNK